MCTASGAFADGLRTRCRTCTWNMLEPPHTRRLTEDSRSCYSRETFGVVSSDISAGLRSVFVCLAKRTHSTGTPLARRSLRHYAWNAQQAQRFSRECVRLVAFGSRMMSVRSATSPSFSDRAVSVKTETHTSSVRGWTLLASTWLL